MHLKYITAENAHCIVPRLIPLLQELHALHVAHQPEKYPANPKENELASWLETWLRQEKTYGLVAESPTGATLGYLIYDMEDKLALPVARGGRRAMVHQLAVGAPFRRMGIGKALMTRMKEDALKMGAERISVTYSDFNTASAGLMRAMGLLPKTIVAEWYPEGPN